MIRVTFGIIVLNGQPFLEYNLRALYPFAHQIIVVEGAVTAARSLATPEGHSVDGTFDMLRKFKVENDPERKLSLLTAEEEGKPNGFWNEKTEMSQAYTRRATGEWLWQVDADEFYLEKDMKTVFDMLESNPEITAVSFPYRQFWGGFDYVETGQWFQYELPSVNRLFSWRQGYQYIEHRPPTVADEKGRDLRTLKWVSHKQMRKAGIYLYHYSYVLPKQAYEKVAYYTNVTWTDAFRENERWLSERYLKLGDPFHVGEGLDYLTWLVRYDGQHPEHIVKMRDDISNGRLKIALRPTGDIESLLSSRSYTVARSALSVLLYLNHVWRLPLRPPKALAYHIFNLTGLHRLWIRLSFIRRRGWRYRHIAAHADIAGFLYEDQVVALYDLARDLPNSHPVAVEIGSFLGKSSLVIAKGMNGKSNPVLYCIDPFNADSDAPSTGVLSKIAMSLPVSLLDQFIANMTKHGVYRTVRTLVGYSHEFAATFPEAIDFLFVDGNHDYEAVLKDFEDWRRHLKPGGIMALHDVDFSPWGSPRGDEDHVGPGLVAKERIVNNPCWSEVRLINNLLVARKVHD